MVNGARERRQRRRRHRGRLRCGRLRRGGAAVVAEHEPGDESRGERDGHHCSQPKARVAEDGYVRQPASPDARLALRNGSSLDVDVWLTWHGRVPQVGVPCPEISRTTGEIQSWSLGAGRTSGGDAGGGSRTLTPREGTPDFKSGAYDQFRHPGEGEAYSRAGRRLLPGRHRREREPLRALAAEGVAEGGERLLVEAVADRDVALAPVAVALVAARVARPRGQRDLVVERRVRGREDPVRALLPEVRGAGPSWRPRSWGRTR